ncbi:MAG: hypothetical protein H0T62_02875 [Parachlamydiaceae bacterium]|nr:hypothetical protein [Parachlamydiaceae bacterium]
MEVNTISPYRSIYIQQSLIHQENEQTSFQEPSIWQKYFVNSAEFVFDIFGESYSITPEQLKKFESTREFSYVNNLDSEHCGWKLWRAISLVAVVIIFPLGLTLLGIKAAYHCAHTFAIEPKVTQLEENFQKSQDSDEEVLPPDTSKENIPSIILSEQFCSKLVFSTKSLLIDVALSKKVSVETIKEELGKLTSKQAADLNWGIFNSSEEKVLLDLFFDHANDEQLRTFVERLTSRKVGCLTFSFLSSLIESMTEKKAQRLISLNRPEIGVQLLRSYSEVLALIPTESSKLLISALYKQSPHSTIWDEISLTKVPNLKYINPFLFQLKMSAAFCEENDLKATHKELAEFFLKTLENMSVEDFAKLLSCFDNLSDFQIQLATEVLISTLKNENLTTVVSKLIKYSKDEVFIPILTTVIKHCSGNNEYIGVMNEIRSQVNTAKRIVSYNAAPSGSSWLPNLKDLLSCSSVYSENTLKSCLDLCGLPGITLELENDMEFRNRVMTNFGFFNESPLNNSYFLDEQELKNSLITFFYKYISDEDFTALLEENKFNFSLFKNMTQEQGQRFLKCFNSKNSMTFMKVIEILNKLTWPKYTHDGKVILPLVDENNPTFFVLKNIEKTMMDDLYDHDSDELLALIIKYDKFNSILLNDLTEQRLQKLIQVLNSVKPTERAWDCMIDAVLFQLALRENLSGKEMTTYKIFVKSLYECASDFEIWEEIKNHKHEKTEVQNAINLIVEFIKSPVEDSDACVEEVLPK